VQIVFLVLGRARHAAVGDDDVAFRIEQQLVRVDAVGFPLGELAQAAAIAHADQAAPVALVGLGGVEALAVGGNDGVAAESRRGAIVVEPELLHQLARAVAAQHPGAGAHAEHQQAAVGFGEQAVRAGGQRHGIANAQRAGFPVGDQRAGEVGIALVRAAPGGADDGLARAGRAERKPGQAGGGAGGGKGEQDLSTVHGCCSRIRI
jgi:hypothetical protein